jgi:hypothetical protein
MNNILKKGKETKELWICRLFWEEVRKVKKIK